MNESLQGIVIFIVIAVGSAIMWHTFLKRIPIAILGSAITSAAIYQVCNYIKLGYLDPLFIISLPTTFATAFIIALIMSIPFRIWRGKQHNKSLKDEIPEHGAP